MLPTWIADLSLANGWMKSIRKLVCVAALSIFFLAEVCSGDERQPSVDFRNDLIPVFTKLGCNAGACHGAAIGRGEFKLSLYGGNPAADYEAIVRHMRGRRVNLYQPDESLILLKPAEYVSHGGGTIFEPESPAAQLLIDWIQQGASNASARELTKVEITPRRHVAKEKGETITLSAMAHYSDGTSRDVTPWTIFQAEDDAAVEIIDPAEIEVDHAASDRQPLAKVVRAGRHIVVARYLNQVVPIEMIVPLSDSTVVGSVDTSVNFIDDEIGDSLAVLGLPPSPLADDATFLRRATFDLTGRLPGPDRVLSYLEDPRPGKRSELIDELLQSDEFTQYWTFQLAKLIRLRPPGTDEQAAQTYYDWLRDQVQHDASYQSMVRSLITATGDSHVVGPANFYRLAASPGEQAELMSELFMGSRLRCANCHNHPLDRWTQDDYHGLAAIFAKVERGTVIGEKPHGQVIHPGTREPAIQRIPGVRFLAADADDGREQLADWLTDPANPYFAKAIVNRLWRRTMGRGLVDPVDDFRDTNPATHPRLLDRLAQDFVEHDYSLRHTLRVIASSSSYARSSRPTEVNRNDDRFYSHAARRPLEPEVLADALSDVMGIPAQYGNVADAAETEDSALRAIELVNPRTPSPSLDILGRCDRQDSCESASDAGGGLPLKLHLFNGSLLNTRIAAPGSRLQRLQASEVEPLEIIHAFYLAALNRLPTEIETLHWRTELEQLDDSDPSDFLEDFVWGLLTCEEFVTNH